MSFRLISRLFIYKMFFLASILEWRHHTCHVWWCHDIAPPRTPWNDQSVVGCNKIHDSKFSTYIYVLVLRAMEEEEKKERRGKKKTMSIIYGSVDDSISLSFHVSPLSPTHLRLDIHWLIPHIMFSGVIYFTN